MSSKEELKDLLRDFHKRCKDIESANKKFNDNISKRARRIRPVLLLNTLLVVAIVVPNLMDFNNSTNHYPFHTYIDDCFSQIPSICLRTLCFLSMPTLIYIMAGYSHLALYLVYRGIFVSYIIQATLVNDLSKPIEDPSLLNVLPSDSPFQEDICRKLRFIVEFHCFVKGYV